MSDTRNYLIVTLSYFLFTLTDGALRMIILLHFYALGYTPFMLASLFLLYEAAGIFANLGGGWLASRFGIPRMLATGLVLQIFGLCMLSALDPGWTATVSLVWVVGAQGLAGVAKDLTKTASKSAIKATSTEGAGQLFYWVSWFTGSKNATKGVGFFLGGFLLQVLGFKLALWSMAGMLSVVLLLVLTTLPRVLGKAKSSKSFRELFSKSAPVNLIAIARVFLFGSRDVWFVVALPVYLYGLGWTFTQVAAFLAFWTIGYGVVQALAPAVVTRSEDGLSREVPAARIWGGVLALIPAVLAGLIANPAGFELRAWSVSVFDRPDLILVGGLIIFGFVFAVISSLHSYLILAYAGSEKAAEDVGFYYAANAAGRLVGILLSGALMQQWGMEACLIGAATMLFIALVVTYLLPSALPVEAAPLAVADQPFVRSENFADSAAAAGKASSAKAAAKSSSGQP